MSCAYRKMSNRSFCVPGSIRQNFKQHLKSFFLNTIINKVLSLKNKNSHFDHIASNKTITQYTNNQQYTY